MSPKRACESLTHYLIGVLWRWTSYCSFEPLSHILTEKVTKIYLKSHSIYHFNIFSFLFQTGTLANTNLWLDLKPLLRRLLQHPLWSKATKTRKQNQQHPPRKFPDVYWLLTTPNLIMLLSREIYIRIDCFQFMRLNDCKSDIKIHWDTY